VEREEREEREAAAEEGRSVVKILKSQL